MKKLLLVLVLVSIVLLIGCNGVTPSLPDEIPFDLINEYIKYDVVIRWADGEIVSVYDETNYEGTRDILNEINAAIKGPIVFQLSNKPNSKIKVIFKEQSYFLSCVHLQWNDAHELTNILIEINPFIDEHQEVYLQYQQAFLISLGIKVSQSYESLTEEIEAVLFWLYRLEPGISLV